MTVKRPAAHARPRFCAGATSLVVAVAATLGASAAHADAAPKVVADGAPALSAASFAAPPASVRPKYRWWLPASAIEDDELRAELRQIKAVGGGGAEVAPFLTPGRRTGRSATWPRPAGSRPAGSASSA